MIRKIGLALVFSATAAMADAPRVAVDIAPVHALVAQVMKGVGTPELIVPPGLRHTAMRCVRRRRAACRKRMR